MDKGRSAFVWYHDLTARERQILRFVARRWGNDEIAATLCITQGTVHNHVTTIYSKLGLHKRSEVIAWVWRQGLMNNSGPRDVDDQGQR